MKIKTLNDIKKYLIFSIILAVALVSGITYAFLQKESVGEDTYSVTTLTCLSISLTSQTNTINLTNAIPTPTEEGMNQAPFNFTVKNNCSKPVNVNLTLEVLSDSTLDAKYVQASVNYLGEKIFNNRVLTEYIKGLSSTSENKNYILSNDLLQANESKSYDLRSWVDYNTTKEQGFNKVFRSKVFITGEYSTSLLQDAILLQGGGKVAIEAKGNPNFSLIAPIVLNYREIKSEYTTTITSNNNKIIGSGYVFNEITGRYDLTNYETGKSYGTNYLGYYTCNSDVQYSSCSTIYQINKVSGTSMTNATKNTSGVNTYNLSDTGLYASADDYGTSYYYRGAKEQLNNNLIFANFQWKIIRINGDGSIRLIYNGTCPGNNCAINTNFPAPFTTSYSRNTLADAKHAGYMFGGVKNVASTSREEAVRNESDSNIKTAIDNWYALNINGTEYASQLSDSLFCNDRSIRSGIGYGGTSNTNFKGVTRIHINKIPSLKCELQNDRFTVSDTTIGNGALIYPVATIAGDEVLFAGIVWNQSPTIGNYYNYLFANFAYWTMTPYYSPNGQVIFHVPTNGYMSELSSNAIWPTARLVINILANTKITGNGTQTNPFKVIS